MHCVAWPGIRPQNAVFGEPWWLGRPAGTDLRNTETLEPSHTPKKPAGLATVFLGGSCHSWRERGLPGLDISQCMLGCLASEGGYWFRSADRREKQPIERGSVRNVRKRK